MELEQLKQEWQLLNNKVEKVELRNRQLTQEIMGNKLKSQFQILMDVDRSKFILILFAIPIMTASMFFRTSLTTGTIICFCVIGLFCLLWQGYIFLALKKCQNKEQSVTTLTINMEHYKLHSKARLIMTLPLLIIILIILYILESKNMNPIIMYGVLPISILGVIFSIPYEIKHLRDISSYMNTLHELKEDYQ